MYGNNNRYDNSGDHFLKRDRRSHCIEQQGIAYITGRTVDSCIVNSNCLYPTEYSNKNHNFSSDEGDTYYQQICQGDDMIKFFCQKKRLLGNICRYPSIGKKLEKKNIFTSKLFKPL